jgi:transposase-like protein
MRAPMMLNVQTLIDDAKCFEIVRHMRWPDGITCPHCTSLQATRQGFDETRPMRQKYECRACRKRFDDLTGTIFAGHHRPLRTRILGLYFMGLNLSNEQIAKELDLNGDDAQKMTSQLRRGIVERRPEVRLSGEVECDEVYVTAGHKGHPQAVRRKGRPGRRRRLKGERGRGTSEKEKPPILGMIRRSGQVVIRMLADVKQVTIAPLIRRTIAKGTVVYTDEYNIYDRPEGWGYSHRTVCHAAGEFARDEDGDGSCEVHVNTIEGFWSLWRSWLRPHRGVSQEKLPLYLGSFEFVHNVRRRGKALLRALIGLLVAPTPPFTG